MNRTMSPLALISTVIFLVVCLVESALVSAAGKRPLTIVTVWAVVATTLTDNTEALGTLKANESVDITASVTETLAAIHFDDGQQVEAGQLLADLDQQEELAQFYEERTKLNELQREVKRLENLVKQRSASQTELDRARTEATSAKFRIAEIEARIADRRIKAPFAGVLGLRNISPGALVSPGALITTLDDIKTLRLDFAVSATLLAGLSQGQTVEASSASYPQLFSGVITAIDSRVNPVDRSIIARAKFENPQLLLKPGMLMQVGIASAPRQTILIPEETLLSREKNHFVWLFDAASNTVSQRQVQLGKRIPGKVEVVSGLAVGEQIIHEGIIHLRPGVEVKVSETATGER